MESWVLEGDSYSFLRSAPCNFSLQHLDGPNHVEIFDITSIPSHRSAISETTCLCDIFGDDCESPALSSSPASASVLKKDVDEQLPVEDVNDSSGSYHTANGSEHLSDGSDTFEDSKDTKDLLTGESNTPSDLTLPNDRRDATSGNASPKLKRHWQESHVSQDTSLMQVENSSDQQLVTSTSEFRDSNIRVSGSTQCIVLPELLSENKGIREQSHPTSVELRMIDSNKEIITPDLRSVTRQMDASLSEQKENESTQKIITPESSSENRVTTEHGGTTTSEVRESDSTEKKKYFNQRESRDSESLANIASPGSAKEKHDQSCSGEEEEKISLPDILPTENLFLVCGTVQSDSYVALNFSTEGRDFTPLHGTASDPLAKEEIHGLREMMPPLEHEYTPSKPAYTATFLCDDKAGLSDLEAANTVIAPSYVDDKTEKDVTSMPHHFNISSETVIVHEDRTLSSFSETTEGPVSCVYSELCSPSGPSEDANPSETPIIIHSPAGFTLCPSPEPKNKIWSAGPEDLASTSESPEIDYRLTPIDKGSVSSFDSNLCPTPEPRSITSTPENRQNVFMCEVSHVESSPELRSASCSPEIKITTCGYLTRHSPQIDKKTDFSSLNGALAQSHDVHEELMHAESFISTTLPHDISSTQRGISSPLIALPRDIVSPDLKETRYTESPASNIISTNDITNIDISYKFSSMDRCTISPHSTASTHRCMESPNVHEIKSGERSILTIPHANEIANSAVLPVTNLSSTEEGLSKSPSISSIPRDTASPNFVETRSTETSDTENGVSSPFLHPSSTEEGMSRPSSPLRTSKDTEFSDADGTICVKNPASTTILTNESTVVANSPLLSHLTIPVDMMSPEVEGITHLSSRDISRSTSPLSIPRNTMSAEVAGIRYVESSISTLAPTNESTIMAISPISSLSSTEEGMSKPSSTYPYPHADGIKCVEIPILATIHTNEITSMANSPIDLSLTGSISRPPSNLSLQRDSMCLDVQETKDLACSNKCLTKGTRNVALPLISNHSTTGGGTSGPSKHTASTDIDGLRCVESSTSTTLQTNEIPNMGIEPVFNIFPTEESLSNPKLALSVPRDTLSPDVYGIRDAKGSNGIQTNEMKNMADSFISNLPSTEGGISRPSSTLSLPRDTMSPDVYGIRDAEGSNDIQTKENKNMASSTSDLTSPLITDTVSSHKTRHERLSGTCNGDFPTAETCPPLVYTDTQPLTTVSEKVDLIPLIVPVDVGQSDDTGNKMSPKSCTHSQDDCTNNTLVTCSQTDEISDSSPEPPAPKLSVKQIKENWERMNESISSSLNPWQTSKKTVPTAKEIKEGNDRGREMLDGKSAGNEKTFGHMAMRYGESPSVLHGNNHGMYKGQSCGNKGWSGERVIQEELTLGKRVGNIAEDTYRGEQVELSFSTRNRKGPANHNPAPSSRDPKSGIPPRYFESPLATRRQQSLLRAQNLQKENKTGARRVRSTSQSNHCGVGRLFSECTSETSSMGSELDDADSEVKWFTDQAFRSLSSPQVDYLDVYNSSRGSSTNVSQPSTVDSPGSATWISYADLHDSLHENDVLCHVSSFLPHGTLDPAKRFEMGSFECVDVALESKEETKKGKRTVPKRQIQFKRRDFDELKSTESDGKSVESLSAQTCSKDTFVRQHSTPASMQEDLVQGDHEIQTGKKMLQKSTSLDDNSSRSKMATDVIKNVLSKKMDTATKESSRNEPCENIKNQIEILSAGESSNAERQEFRESSSLQSECRLSSEDFASKEGRSPRPQKRICRPKVPPKPVFKANSLPPNNNPACAEVQGKTLVKDQIRPPMIDSFESKISKKQPSGNSEKDAAKMKEKYNSDSRSVNNQSPNHTSICVASTRDKMTNSDNTHPMTAETYKQQEGSSSMFLSKTPEITLKPCNIKDKYKSSLKSPLSPELEINKDTIDEPLLKDTLEEQVKFKTGVEAGNEEDTKEKQVKSVIHKVRDVRKLVKNTYSLSFKASDTTQHVEEEPEKQKEVQPENLHPLHIECKAISWKDKTASCNKSKTNQDEAQTADKSKMPESDTLINRNIGVTKITSNTSLSNNQHSDIELFVGLDKGKNISKSGNCDQSTKLEMPPRPSSKEISTLVFLQDTKPMQKQESSPACPNAKTVNGSHSVSLLRKEKGMQADIGVCDVLTGGAGTKLKHINRLEVPLHTFASEGSSKEPLKVKKEDADLQSEQKTSLNSGLQTSEGTMQVKSSPKPKEVRVHPSGEAGDNQSQGDLLQSPKEQGITVAASSKAEVKSFSSNTKIHAMPVTTPKEIELPIQVRSISSDRPKPSVLPKPSYKQPFAEIRSTSSDVPKTDITPTTSILKEQAHLKTDVKIIETSATVIRNEQSTNTASSNTKTLAVSAVSSHKPQTIPVTTMPSSAQKSTATINRQEVSITSVQNSSNQQQQNIQEQVIAANSYPTNQPLPIISQAITSMQPTVATSSNNQLHKDTDFQFPTSDDPPSYDERESFSPLHISDLPTKRQNRYHPTTKHSLCSCTSCTQFGQPYHGSQQQTPPATRSPGQVISYPGAPPQAQVRPHQCRPDGQTTIYPPASPKSTAQHAPAMIQPMHHSHGCPAPAIQPYGNEQQQPSTLHLDRRSGNQRSPQAPSGATYREHSRSPNIAALDPRSQFFNSQELPPAFGHEYGSDGPGGGGMLYPENASGLGYGQGPRRVLLDPETGKYFYIEVPMQPLRKMLFDPEIGQYVEVLIPQQAMSNSSMFPPTAAPYQGSYHGQGLYTSQYLPYAMPPHPQSAQQPRHPEPSVPTSLHQSTMGFGSTASQVPKSDVKGHPSLDQSYLESMYYIPTGMNASPNSTPSDCYHKPATNMPAAGGRRA